MYIKREDKPITREQAIEFCRDRQQLQKTGAEHFAKTELNIEDEISVAKYNNRINLSNIYGDIADILEGK